MNRSLLLFAIAAFIAPHLSAQSAPAATPFFNTATTNVNCKGGQACEEHTGVFSTPVRQNGEGHRDFITQDFRTFGPSINFGNTGGWTVTHVNNAPHVVFGTSGIDQFMSGSMVKNGTGDLAALYFYAYGGGRSTKSDEGVTGITVESGEINGYFHGVIAGGAAHGAVSLALAKTSNAPHNWEYTCAGCMLLDISKGTLAGRLNGKSQRFGKTYLYELPTISDTVAGAPARLPITKAWCTTTVAIPPTATAGLGTSRTVQCTLGAIGNATPAFAPGVVTIAGPDYPEQAMITSTGSPSGGVQTLTLLARNPNPAGAVIFQGGIAGQSLSFDDNLATTGFRTSYYVFGSTDGVNLIYGSVVAGSLTGYDLPRLGSEAEGYNSGFHLYPSAEIVANSEAAAAPSLEPNNVAWETGDTVENPRYMSFGGAGVRDVCSVYTPSDQSVGSACLMVELHGPGISGLYRPIRFMNLNPYNTYAGYGGVPTAPVGMAVSGPFLHMILMDDAPANGGSVVAINNSANREGKPFNLFSLPGLIGPGGAVVSYDPKSLTVGFPKGITTGSIGTRDNCTGINCGASATGSFALPAGSKTVDITDSAVTANSQIFITPDASLDTRLNLTCNKDLATAFAPAGIVARTPGHSFTVGVASAPSAPNCYSFIIIN